MSRERVRAYRAIDLADFLSLAARRHLSSQDVEHLPGMLVPVRNAGVVQLGSFVYYRPYTRSFADRSRTCAIATTVLAVVRSAASIIRFVNSARTFLSLLI